MLSKKKYITNILLKIKKLNCTKFITLLQFKNALTDALM